MEQTNISTENSEKKKRIDYIDAMRGINMIMLVVVHVAGFCLHIESDVPSFITYFNEIMLPLFFFISGLVFYREEHIWNISFSIKQLYKKACMLIVPTCIFFSIFIYTKNIDAIGALTSDSKAGYWFTFVLFEYFIFYSIIRSCLTVVRLRGMWEDIIVIACSMALFIVTISSVLVYIPIDGSVLGFLSFKHWCYFVYFCIGTIVKKHFDIVQCLFDGKVLITCCLTIFFGLNVFREPFMSCQYNLFRLLTATTGIVAILGYFRHHSELFSHSSWVGRRLCYIGRRTLDIYFLHYFLLPLNLYYVFPFFTEKPMPVMELSISLAVSIVIIFVCVVIGNLLRSSPFLSYFLFGTKR
jgi:hypothetical protein